LQTDVSGVWIASRSIRLRVYLAGIAIQLGIASVAVFARLAAGQSTVTGRALGALVLLSLLLIVPQLLLFMRTDLYFVLQDLAGCSSLYADGSAYARHRVRYLLRRIRGGGTLPPDPSAALVGWERRAVRSYAPILIFGTAFCLLFAAVVTVPTALTLLTNAAASLVGGVEGGRVLDGALTFLIVGGFWVVWCRVWWERHGHKIINWWTRSPLSGHVGR
jgi:hypothetical protein